VTGAAFGGTTQEAQRVLEARARNAPDPVALNHSTGQFESAKIDAARRAVVRVATFQNLGGWSDDKGPPSRSGYGFVVRENGIVLTASRLVADARNVAVILQDGRTLPVTAVAIDSLNDLAMLRVNSMRLQAAPMGSSGELRVGDKVIALGGPVVGGTVGTVRATGAATGGELAIDARPNGEPRAGLPLLNARGEVIGILTDVSQTRSGSALEFAVPIDRAKRLLDNLRPAPYVVPGDGSPNVTVNR
jgi:S1-C subfamily serine protease